MKIKYINSIIILVIGTMLPLGAQAGAQSGFYIGAGLGDTNIVGSQDTLDVDFDSNGYKFLLGYNFGVVPLIDLGVEGAYVNFGEESTAGATFEETSWNGFGVAGLSFGPLGIFAKMGMASWDTKTRIGSISLSDSGSDPVYGLGARIQLGAMSLRVEYEEIDQSDFDDVSMVSASLLYTF